ncbi:hypothetical protein MN608_03700 [Microdochium nivale]|nr:hypothetical protein MN608_03700 [Microdochium nivale]
MLSSAGRARPHSELVSRGEASVTPTFHHSCTSSSVAAPPALHRGKQQKADNPPRVSLCSLRRLYGRASCFNASLAHRQALQRPRPLVSGTRTSRPTVTLDDSPEADIQAIDDWLQPTTTHAADYIASSSQTSSSAEFPPTLSVLIGPTPKHTATTPPS